MGRVASFLLGPITGSGSSTRARYFVSSGLFVGGRVRDIEPAAPDTTESLRIDVYLAPGAQSAAVPLWIHGM